MAYMNQSKKAIIQKALKPVLAKYGVKGTLRVRNNHAITLTLRSGAVDFVRDMKPVVHGRVADKVALMQNYHFSINTYWYADNYEDTARAFLGEALAALKSADWYDRSDAQVDYFDTAYYVDIDVGTWKQPYTVTP